MILLVPILQVVSNVNSGNQNPPFTGMGGYWLPVYHDIYYIFYLQKFHKGQYRK